MFVDDLSLPTRTGVARILAGLGGVAVIVGFVLAVSGGVLPAPARAPAAALAESLGKSLIAWTLAATGCAYALWRIVRGRRRPPVAPDLATDPPEASALEGTRTGNRFEILVENHVESVRDPDDPDDRIRAALIDVLLDVETQLYGRSPDRVTADIRAGEWTTDRIPAAYLGGEEAPGYPLRSRIRGWLRPTRAYEHRVERTVAAIRDRIDAHRIDPAATAASDERSEVAT